MFTVEKVVAENLPRVNQTPWLAKPTKAALKYLLHEQECNQIADSFAHLEGIDFVEQVLAEFNFSYLVPDQEVANIPVEGRLVIFANHPIGSLDGLALIKLISEVRSDVKVVANELLMNIPPLHPMLLPVRNMTGGTPKQHLANIHKHLQQEGVVLIFPSGEVSRLRPNGIRDTEWQSGFLKMAMACDAPLLPIYVDAKNSAAFYGASMIYKPLATLLLVKEMFKQAQNTIGVRIGELIPNEAVASNHFPLKTNVKLLRNHLYRIGKNRSGLFTTQKAIAHPESKVDLIAALKQCELLGQTQDNKQIYLYQHTASNPIMREIGRLREIAFRAVGEGIGLRRDTDKYDRYYQHLVLWDQDDLEIVGAYRFACAAGVHRQQGPEQLYSQSLFTYAKEFAPYFEQGLELGRSFVQPKYWGKRSLDYLWYGIGAFLAKNPQYRYLFGPVTISNQLPANAKNMLVHFYQTQFAYGATLGANGGHESADLKEVSNDKMAEANLPFRLTPAQQQALDALYRSDSSSDNLSATISDNYSENFKVLKHSLANIGASVPTLFKQYAEVCQPGGVAFLEFGIDVDFANCIDGLVLVDTQQLKPKKRRYIDSHQVDC
ncbi:GNAT family N-acyltransferase [Shewanella gelidii]|uniref:L-ornithine N(alpha)-acyltransferase n=1 Tax=Shewanella gelidii TaxID=1642821 RepID=A0A917JMR5_9GAMM|nr:lysophospholipid acyltransferase family protein [Shewanella gelidii]MCL1097900.1 lysophospholipid acyltransferase family protein [Shewanella gelidii]GGI77875.1 acyltransferase [Shewanella gelidii]